MSENPYEPANLDLSGADDESKPEGGNFSASSRRLAFVYSMWICGIAAIQLIPIYPWDPQLWVERGVSISIHWAWLAPFSCSVASVVTGMALFSLPRWADKVGAVFGVMIVGWWPGGLAIFWWYFFATHQG